MMVYDDENTPPSLLFPNPSYINLSKKISTTTTTAREKQERNNRGRRDDIGRREGGDKRQEIVSIRQAEGRSRGETTKRGA